jgi:hypothetical protein
MKTLINSNDKAEVLARLQSVHPATPRRGGKMSAHQMVGHLADGFRLPGAPHMAGVTHLFAFCANKWGHDTVCDTDRRFVGPRRHSIRYEDASRGWKKS